MHLSVSFQYVREKCRGGVWVGEVEQEVSVCSLNSEVKY